MVVEWALIFHLFGVIVWMGSLLLICSMLALVDEENGAARGRMVVMARRLLHAGGNIGAALAIFFGILLIVLNPGLMRHGWLHAKLGLVALILVVQFWIYRRVTRMEIEPAALSPGQARAAHGILSLLLLAVLALAVLRPF